MPPKTSKQQILSDFERQESVLKALRKWQKQGKAHRKPFARLAEELNTPPNVLKRLEKGLLKRIRVTEDKKVTLTSPVACCSKIKLKNDVISRRTVRRIRLPINRRVKAARRQLKVANFVEVSQHEELSQR